MFVTTIAIRREGYYGSGYGARADASKPFRATIEVLGDAGKVELNLSPELSERIIAVIADEVIAASKATAEAMTAEVFNVVALPSPEAA